MAGVGRLVLLGPRASRPPQATGSLGYHSMGQVVTCVAFHGGGRDARGPSSSDPLAIADSLHSSLFTFHRSLLCPLGVRALVSYNETLQ